jgi:hypothetical protein
MLPTRSGRAFRGQSGSQEPSQNQPQRSRRAQSWEGRSPLRTLQFSVVLFRISGWFDMFDTAKYTGTGNFRLTSDDFRLEMHGEEPN